MDIESTDKTGFAPSTAIDRPSPWLEIALIFAVFYVAGGAPAPHINETYYLTKAKHYWQPEWCEGDQFLDSADAHLTFYWTVGWLAKFFLLPTVAWIGRVTAWFLLACSWHRLSTRVVDGPFRSVLTAMLFYVLIDQANFAGEWVIGGVESKCFAYALVFCGLAALADAQWRLVWTCFGAAGAFHILVGGWSAIAASLVWVTQSQKNRPPLHTMLPSLLLGSCLALPGVLPAMQLTAGALPEVRAEANRIYVFDRLPHHLAPLTMSSDDLLVRAGPFAILVLALGGLGVAFRTLRRRPGHSPGSEQSALRLDRLLWFTVWTLAIAFGGLVWELVTWNYPVLSARLLKFYLFRLSDIAVPLATSLLVVWQINRLLEVRSRWATVFMLLVVLVPGWLMINQSSDRWFNKCPPADRKVKGWQAWQEACLWTREHTPQNALFLVPRFSQSFQWFAHRADVVTWKNVPQDAETLLSWRDRYFDVFTQLNQAGDQVSSGPLAEQGTLRVRSLAAKYGASYAITGEYPPLQLPVVYANEGYAIYALTTDARRRAKHRDQP